MEAFARLLSPRTRLVAISALSNALGTVTPLPEHHPRGACGRRRGAGRRRAGGVPHARERAGARLRLLRPDRAQAVRPDRHRRALRQGGAARGDAAVDGWRRHDRLRDVRALHLERDARTSSRRARPDISGAIGLGVAVDYVSGDRHGPRSRPTSRSCSPTARTRSPGGRPEDRRHRAAQGQHPVVRDGGHPPSRPRDHRRSRGRGHPHRASLRAAGDGSARHSGHGPRLAGDVQHARGDRRAGGGAAKARKVFG